MDRINTWVGFTSLNKAVGSIFSYKKANSYPFVPRVDYTELYLIINERYGSSIDIDTIGGLRRWNYLMIHLQQDLILLKEI